MDASLYRSTSAGNNNRNGNGIKPARRLGQ